MTDSDYFVVGATIVIVLIVGSNLCFLVGIRAKLNDTNRRVDSIASRYGRLMDFLEEKEILKRKGSGT